MGFKIQKPTSTTQKADSLSTPLVTPGLDVQLPKTPKLTRPVHCYLKSTGSRTESTSLSMSTGWDDLFSVLAHMRSARRVSPPRRRDLSLKTYSPMPHWPENSFWKGSVVERRPKSVINKILTQIWGRQRRAWGKCRGWAHGRGKTTCGPGSSITRPWETLERVKPARVDPHLVPGSCRFVEGTFQGNCRYVPRQLPVRTSEGSILGQL